MINGPALKAGPFCIGHTIDLSPGPRDRVAINEIVEWAFNCLREIIGETSGRLCDWIWRHVHGWVVWVTGWSALAVPVTILLIMAIVAGTFCAIVMVGQASVS